MSSRRTGVGAEKTYTTAETWVNCSLRNDGSLFTPGEAIWTRELPGELHTRFLNQPDESKRDFFEKLEEQLWNSSTEVFHLMGEVLYFHYLPFTNTTAHKRQRIQQVLGWSPSPVYSWSLRANSARNSRISTSALSLACCSAKAAFPF